MTQRPSHDELEKEAFERQRAGKTLRESEEKYRVIFENIQDVYYESSLDGIILEVSPSIESISKYKRDELIGKSLNDIYTNPAERDELLKIILEQGKVNDFEVNLTDKDGSQNPCSITTLLIMDEQGNPLKLVGSMRDLRERKRAEEALRESEERFRAIFETAQDSIFIKDHDLKYTHINPSMERLFRVPVSQIVGKSDEELLGAEAGIHIKEVDIRVLNGEIVEEVDTKPVDGIFKTFHVIKVPMRDKSGGIIGLCGIARDITDQKQTEGALRERTEELEIKTKSLEEINTAMKVLLKKRQEDKLEIEDNVLTNVKELIAPYFDKIKATKLDEQQKVFLSIIESNMNEIISPFTRRLSLKYLKLTPTEIKIANMIKHGYTTKKIAKIMNISPRTVDTHRKNIRQKIGLDKKRANLRSHLLALH